VSFSWAVLLVENDFEQLGIAVVDREQFSFPERESRSVEAFIARRAELPGLFRFQDEMFAGIICARAKRAAFRIGGLGLRDPE